MLEAACREADVVKGSAAVARPDIKAELGDRLTLSAVEPCSSLKHTSARRAESARE